jgi:hypothetical protein
VTRCGLRGVSGVRGHEERGRRAAMAMGRGAVRAVGGEGDHHLWADAAMLDDAPTASTDRRDPDAVT